MNNTLNQQGSQLNTTLNQQGAALSQQGSQLNTTLNQQGAALSQQGSQLNNTLNQQGNQFNTTLNQQGAALSQQGSQLNNTLNQQGSAITGAVDQQGSQLNNTFNQQAALFNNTLNQQGGAIMGAVDQQGNQLNNTLNQQGSQFNTTLNQQGTQLTNNISSLLPVGAPAKMALASTLVIAPVTSEITWYMKQAFQGALSSAAAFKDNNLKPSPEVLAIMQTFATGLSSVKQSLLEAMRVSQFVKLTNEQFKDYLVDKKAALEAAGAGIGDGAVESIPRVMEELQRSYFVPYMTRELMNKLAQVQQAFAGDFGAVVRGALAQLSDTAYVAFVTQYQGFKAAVTQTFNSTVGFLDSLNNSFNAAAADASATSSTATAAINDAYNSGLANSSSTALLNQHQEDPLRSSLGVNSVTTTDPTTGATTQAAVRRGG